MVEILTRASKEKIIEEEIKVLDVLEQHAKESIGEIAKKCGFSHQKIWRVIKNLEKKKTIWGYSTIVNAEEKDLKYFILLLKRSTVPLDNSMQKEVIFGKLDDRLSNRIKIDDILITHGIHDAVMTFYAPDLMTAKKFIDRLFGRLGKYFQEYQLLETLFPVRKNGFKNPQIKQLIEYI